MTLTADAKKRVVIPGAALLKKIENLSASQAFDLYESGLINKDEAWWTAKMSKCSSDERQKLSKLRDSLIADSY